MSLRTRAVIAVGLFFGFYLLALAMVGALAYIPYAAWEASDGLRSWHLKIGGFCFLGIFLIVRGIIPRRDRFEAPGPRLERAQHPRLFAMIDDVARQTAQEPPAELYLVAEVNAWVSRRDDVMGFGGRPIMGLGLPLMEVLSVQELRAVVAHEFGHYVGGDTRLGPWIYRTREGIGRVLGELEQDDGSILAKPFEWYGAGFVRVTSAISRAQEFVADATAARVAGVAANQRALTRSEGAAPALDGYMRSELFPAVARGFRPPVAEGFRRYLAHPRIAALAAAHVDHALEHRKTGPYDTHPSLHERLAALDRLPAPAPRTAPDDDHPSLSLLGSVEAAERALLGWMVERFPAEARPPKSLTRVSWDEVPSTVLPIGWAETVEPARARLAGLTPEALPALLRDEARLVERFADRHSIDRLAGRGAEHAHAVVACALALALLRRTQVEGARVRLDAPPGAPVAFVADGEELLPFAVIDELQEGTIDEGAWRERCERFGIAGVDLGAGVVVGTTTTAARPS